MRLRVGDILEAKGWTAYRLHKESGKGGYEAHGGFFQSLMRTMTSKELKTRHWQWLPEDIKTDDQSKVLFFGGCAPYFDTYFRHHLGVKTSDTAHYHMFVRDQVPTSLAEAIATFLAAPLD